MRDVSVKKVNRMIKEEIDDSTFDIRLARRWKRRCIVSQNTKPVSCGNAAKTTLKNDDRREDTVLVDEDYRIFLDSLVEHVDEDDEADAKYVDDGHHDYEKENSNSPYKNLSDNDVDDMDPLYKLFLEHLRVDGESYVLETAINNERVVIKYEEEDGLCDGLPANSPEGLESAQTKVNTGTTRILRSASRKEKTESPKVIGTISGSERAKNPKELRSVYKENPNTPRRVTRISNKSPMSEVFLREYDSEFRLERAKKPKELRGVYKENPITPAKRKSAGLEDSVLTSRRVSRNSNKSPKSEVFSATKHLCESESESDMMDESYRTYLNSLTKDGEDFVFTPENGKSVKLEENDKSDDDSEVIVMDTVPCCGQNRTPTPFVTSKSVGISMNINSNSPDTSSHSQFRERLLEVLERPYDPDEYEAFLQEVTCRRAVVRDRNLRNGHTKSYKLDSLGKSYLDLYRDLAEKIDLVRSDRHRALNLLRGFFYWLKNLAHEGAFRPWLDPYCLKVLPQR